MSDVAGPDADPVLAKRAKVARLTSGAIRAGGGCYLLATVLFFYAVVAGFTDFLAGAITVLLILGSALLAPAMVFHYAVKAADRADREGVLVTDSDNQADQDDNGTAPSRGRLPGPQRRAQVLAVARRVLSDRGFHGTTMTDIAEAAGVTKPVLYQHFSSKRELYRTVLEDIGARLESAVIESAVAAPTPRARAEAGIRAFANFVELDHDGFRLLFDGTNRHDEEWAVITRDVERSLANAVAALIDVPSADVQRRQVLAHGIIGLAESMMRQAKAEAVENGGGSDDASAYAQDQLVRDITSLAWAGLRGIES